MAQINLAEAKAHLSELVERAAAGERITITKRGRAVAEVSSAEPELQRIRYSDLHEFSQTLPKQLLGADEFFAQIREAARY